jgi:hypothetical protein
VCTITKHRTNFDKEMSFLRCLFANFALVTLIFGQNRSQTTADSDKKDTLSQMEFNERRWPIKASRAIAIFIITTFSLLYSHILSHASTNHLYNHDHKVRVYKIVLQSWRGRF